MGFIILDYEHGSRGKGWEQGWEDIDILYIYYSLSISFAQKAQKMQKYCEIKRKLLEEFKKNRKCREAFLEEEDLSWALKNWLSYG